MRPLKSDPPTSLIRPRHRCPQLPSPRRHAQHSSSSSIEFPIPPRSPRVKNFHTLNLPSLSQPDNILPHVKRPRISSRRHHYAHRRILRPLKVPFAHSPRNRRLQRIHQIALQPHQNRLRLRIAKPAIKFQNHRTPRRHHQPAIKHALIFRTFRLHPRNHRLRNMIHQPIPHLVIDNIGGRISPHPSRVQPRISITNSL